MCQMLEAVVAPAAAGDPPRSADRAPADSARAASAAGRGGLPLHLEDALRLALRDNWDLRSARAAVATAEAGLRAARAHPNPQLAALVSRIHADGHDATDLGNDLWSRSYDTVIQLGQELDFGTRGARSGAARAGVDAARARLADERRTLVAATTRTYVAAALAEADASIARQSAGYLSGEARIAEARWQAGDISRSDRDQIEIAASRLELDARNAEAGARAQRIVLELLLGLPQPAGELILADSLEALAERASAPAGTAPAAERADLAAARADLRRADEQLRLERRERLPDPTLLGQVEHEPPIRTNSIGLGLSFPLPLWNLNGGAIAAADVERDEAARAVGRIEAEIASDIATARVGFDEAVTRWRRYHDELRPRADEVRRTVSLAYERGGASLLDLLEAQRSDNDVRLAAMQAAGDAADAAATLAAALAPMTAEAARP